MSDDATVKFGYDGRSLYAGMDTLEGKLKRHAGGIESIFSRTGKGISRALESAISLKGAVFAGGAAAMVAYAKHTLETYDLVASESKKLNTSAETLQRLGEAADILGNTDLESLSKGLLKLRRQIIDEPAGDLAKGLEEAGLKVEDFLRLDADDQMLSLADAFEKASAKGNALPLLTRAMGKGFAELIPLLSAGRGELKQFMDDAHVMSNATVAAADELNDKWDVMTTKVGFLGKSLAMASVQGAAGLLNDLGKVTGLFDLGIKKPEIDHDGSKAAAKDAEAAAANKARRDAEADAAAKKAARIQHDQLIARDRDLEKRRAGIKLARDEVDIMELELQGLDKEARKKKEQSFIEKRSHEHSDAGLDANASIALAMREWAVEAARMNRLEKERGQAQKKELENKRENLQLERRSVELTEAQAKGQERKVKKMQDEAFIRQRAHELSEKGLDAEAAIKQAKRELKARKDLDEYEKTGRAKIGGVKKKSNMHGGDYYTQNDSNLDQFHRNQEKEEHGMFETPAPGYRRGQRSPRHDAFGIPPTSAQRGGRYMGGWHGGTRGYNEAEVRGNAKAHIAANSNDIGGKLDTSNKHLKSLVEGIV